MMLMVNRYCGSGQADAVLWKTPVQNLLLQEEEEDVENEGVLTVVTVENQVKRSKISPHSLFQNVNICLQAQAHCEFRPFQLTKIKRPDKKSLKMR